MRERIFGTSSLPASLKHLVVRPSGITRGGYLPAHLQNIPLTTSVTILGPQSDLLRAIERYGAQRF